MGEKNMAYVFDLVYKDYNPDKPVTRIKHTIPLTAVASDNGVNYETAKGIMADTVTFASTASLSNVYGERLRWEAATAYTPSSNIAANNNNRLSINFSLYGKKQTAVYSIPAPDESLVRDSDRRVSNALVSALGLVTDVIQNGYIVLSDGDEPTAVRDADLVTVKGKYQE